MARTRARVGAMTFENEGPLEPSERLASESPTEYCGERLRRTEAAIP